MVGAGFGHAVYIARQVGVCRLADLICPISRQLWIGLVTRFPDHGVRQLSCRVELYYQNPCFIAGYTNTIYASSRPGEHVVVGLMHAHLLTVAMPHS